MKYTHWITAMACFFAFPFAASAEAVQIHVQDVPVRVVLEGLARSNGFNVIVDDTVQGTLTMHLDNVSAEEALDAILQSQQLYCKQTGSLRTITAGRKDGQGKSYYTWHLQYAAADDVADAARALIEEDRVRSYPDTNTLVVSGSWQDGEAVGALVRQLDQPAKQVQLEAVVLSADRNALKQAGVEWDWSAIEGGSGHGVFSFASQIYALEEKGKAQILARPHIMAANGKKAHILIGDKIPVVTEHIASGEKTSTIEYEEAGIKLTYVPRIHEDDSVTAAIEAEVSTPVYVPELKAYRIATRQAQTVVRMAADQTLAIGGLLRKEEIESFRKVPLLGDIPLLGKLFRSHYKSSKDTEVVILLRSHVVPSTDFSENSVRKTFT